MVTLTDRSDVRAQAERHCNDRRRDFADEFETAAGSDTVTSMTAMTCPPATHPLVPAGSGRPCGCLRAAMPRPPIRDMLFAAWFVLAASAVVHAEEHLPDWIPEVLAMPEDAEVVTDRAIGSTVRMLSIATGADIDALFAEWQQSLNEGDYPIKRGAEDLMDRAIEFSGPGIANAKIILAPTTDDGRSVIDFDATLN